MQLSCIVIAYNSKKYLEGCMRGLQTIRGNSCEIILIDNASSDDGAALIEEKFSGVKIFRLPKNLGYAGGANFGIKQSTGEFVMIVNPDVVVEPEYAERLIDAMRADDKIAAATGKLLGYDFDKKAPTGLIDSAGLMIFKNRRCVDRGQGEEDKGQYDRAEEVFGVSGACPMYRRSALEDAKINDEYFDEDFFMYKEDVDLSWRLRLLGWKCWYEPSAQAFHARGTGVAERKTFGEIRKHRLLLSPMQRALSYRNERWMRLKNDDIGTAFHHAPQIISKELLHAGYILIRENEILSEFPRIARGIRSMLKKRAEVMKKRRVSVKEIAHWFV